MSINYATYLFEMDIAGIKEWSTEILEVRLRLTNNHIEKCERDIYGKDKPRAPRQVYSGYQWATNVKREIETVLKDRGVMEKTETDLMLEDWWKQFDI